MEKNINDALYEYIPIAFLNMLNNSNNIIYNTRMIDLKKYDSELCTINDEIYYITKNLDYVLKYDKDKKEALMSKLLSYKNILIDRFLIVYGYNSELATIFTELNNQEHVAQIRKNKPINLYNDNIINDCINFIYNDNTESLIQEKIRKLLKFLPIRLTKNKFYEYIELSIKQNNFDENILFNYTNLIKRVFNPSVFEDYNYYKIISTKLDEYKKIDFTNYSLNELDIIGNELNEFNINVFFINNIIVSLFNYINSLELLLILKNTDLNLITSYNFSYNDLYKKTCEFLDKEKDHDFDFFYDTLSDLFQKNMTTHVQKYEKSVQKINELLENYDTLSDEIKKSIYFERTIRTQLEITIIDYIIYDHPNNTDYTYKEIIDDLILFFENNINEMSNYRRKLSMQKILSFLTPFWGKEEFIDYLKSSINYINDEDIKTLTFYNIGYILNEYGYFEK